MDDMFEKPTAALSVASVLMRSGQAKYSGLVRGISFRVPVPYLAAVDAMAETAVISRNSMLSQLVKAGIEAVQAELPETTRKAIQDRTAALMAEYSQPENGTL